MTTAPSEPGTSAELARLARYCNVKDAASMEDLQDALDTASGLVAKYIGAADVPAALQRRARLKVASELYHAANAPGGIMQQFTDVGGSAVRLARDPMLAAYPLLDPFLPGGFA